MVTQLKDWVLLSYRVPREPSTPRIAIWRQLRDLGVVKVGDGLVALPASARNRERLQWVAAKALEADGEAIVWDAVPGSKRDHRELSARQKEARTIEYQALLDQVSSEEAPTKRTIARWRRAWRAIDKRDYFDAPLREEARAAIQDRVAAAADAAEVGQ